MKNTRTNNHLASISVIAGKTAAALLLGATAAGPARATISFVDMFRNNNFVQTSNGSAANDLSYLTFDLFATQANEFTTVLGFYPGPGSPVPLTENTPAIYNYSTGFFPNQAAMDTAFPQGAYTFTANSPSEALTTSFNYTANAFPLTVPFLSGTNFSSLQGMNTAAPFSFQLSPFTPNAGATASYLFLTIFETVSGNVTFDFGFNPSNTTSLTVPANTLTPGLDYTYQLIFSDRVTVASPGADFPAQIGFDERTTGSFTPALPEPGSAILLCAGGALLLRRRQRATHLRISA